MARSRLLEETLEDGTARDYQRGFAEYRANISIKAKVKMP
jgi:hypothetical protein